MEYVYKQNDAMTTHDCEHVIRAGAKRIKFVGSLDSIYPPGSSLPRQERNQLSIQRLLGRRNSGQGSRQAASSRAHLVSSRRRKFLNRRQQGPGSRIQQPDVLIA